MSSTQQTTEPQKRSSILSWSVKSLKRRSRLKTETAESVETEFTWGNQKEVASWEAPNRNQDTYKSHEDKNKNLDKLQSKNTHKHTHTQKKRSNVQKPLFDKLWPPVFVEKGETAEDINSPGRTEIL